MATRRKLDRTGRLRRFYKRQPAGPELARARVDHATCVAIDNPRFKEKLNEDAPCCRARLGRLVSDVAANRARLSDGKRDAPLTQWLKWPTTYRSKDECEHVLDRDIRRTNSKNRKVWVNFYKQAQCIASDDPRLKGN